MKTKPQTIKEPLIIETFRSIGGYEISSLTQKDPSCFNGSVRIEKLRITVEVVEEPKEVYADRLQKLWEESDNHHHYRPLEDKAKELGIELLGSHGAKKKRK